MTSVKEKKKPILLIICAVLSTLLIVMGLVEFFLPCDGLDCLSKALIIFYLPIFLLYIWGFYFGLILFKFLYKKKKILAILLVILVLVLIHIPSIIKISNPEKKDLSYVFSSIYYSKKDFLIDNDTIYYYDHNYNTSDYALGMLFDSVFDIEKTTRTLNSMDLDGTNNQIICSDLDESFIDSEFYFVENNELYYGDGVNYKAINLTTCEITKEMDEYNLIQNPNHDGIVYMRRIIEENEEVVGNDIVKYDMINDKVINERKITYGYYDSIVIEHQNFNVYTSKYDYELELTNVYMNENLILTKDNVDMQVLLVYENRLLLADDNKIYVVDLNNNRIIEEIEHDFENITIISNNSGENYFMADERIYTYDQNGIVDALNIVTDNYYKQVYSYNNKLVFDSEYCNILVYDQISKEIKQYDDVLYKIDNDKLYIISNEQNKDKVNIEVIE